MRILGRIILYLGIVWSAGFVLFLQKLPEQIDLSFSENADGVVVLTGGKGRIETGIKLLEAEKAGRLLISGVNPAVNEKDLKQVPISAQPLYRCCIDLDHLAQDTYGNAIEAAKWANSHNFSRLIVVTDTYHMPRSLVLFQNKMPEMTLLAYPVDGQQKPYVYIKEYNKYLATLIRIATGL